MFTCPNCKNEIDHVCTSEIALANIVQDPDGKHYLKSVGSDGIDIFCPDCSEDIADAFDLVNSDL